MRRLFVVLMLLSSPLMANAAPDTQIRDLMLKAMKSPDGTASTDVTGRLADNIRQTIKSPGARVYAQVTTVSSLPQGGCKRMKVRFTTPDNRLAATDGTKHPLDIYTTFDICENGQLMVAGQGNTE